MATIIEFVNSAGSRWAGWALAALLDTTALLALVSLIWLAIRRRVAPQVGYGLFLLVPLKLLLPVSIAVPAAIARWTPSEFVSQRVETGPLAAETAIARSIPTRPADPRAVAPSVVQPGVDASSSSPVPDAPPQKRQPPAMAVALNDAVGSAAEPRTGRTSRLTAEGWVFCVWLSVVAVLLGRFVHAQWRFRRGLTALPPRNTSQFGVDLPELCRRAGIRRTIRVVASDLLPAPAVWGIVRPTIILPASLIESLSPVQLRWILLHELAHVRRHDLAMVLLERIAAIGNFFNPAVWVANRVADRLREYACDDVAMALAETSPVETSEAFLRVVSYAGGSRRTTAGALGAFGLGSRAACLERVRRLLDSDRPLHTRCGAVSLLGLTLLAALSLPHLRAASQEPKTDKGSAAKPPDTASEKQTGVRPAAEAAKEATVESEKSFELRIVDAEGKPVPKAEVEFRASPPPKAEQFKAGTFIRAGRYAAFAGADDEGRVSVELPQQPQHFELLIQIPGYGPYCARWSSGEQQGPIPARFTAELEGAWSVGGIVVDAEGKPVEGASVRPGIEYKKRPGDHGQLHGGAPQRTGPDGKWHYDSVPISMEKVFVEIDHSGFKSNRRRLTRAEFGIGPNQQPSTPIALDRGLTVTGKVTDEAGNPIAGALIRTKFLNDIRQATTAADGTYRLGGCEPVAARLVASAKGRATDLKELRLDPGMGPVDFRMPPGGKVRVRVLDEKGDPVPKARIFFQRWRGRIEYFEFDHVGHTADEQGVWEWNEAPLDEFRADICPPEGMSLNDQPLLARGEEFVFRTPPALLLTGKVFDAETKEPIRKFQVLPGVRSSETHMNWVESMRFSGTEGTFVYRQTHGYFAHMVRVEASGYRNIASRDVKSDEGNVTIEFAMKKGVDIAAKVVTPDLKPAAKAKIALGVAGSQVNLENGDIEPAPYATRQDTDDSGSFRFPPQETDFQLIITHPAGYAHLKAKPDWEAVKIIRLEPWARVEGSFRVGPEHMANVPITINMTGPHSYGEGVPSIFTHYDTTTGPDGRFVFERVFADKGWIGRRIMLSSKDGAAEAISAITVPVEFVGGKTSRVLIGGTGRAVVGKLQPPAGFEGRVPWNFALLDVRAIEKLETSPSFSVSVDRDGSFRIDDVPEGKYILHLQDFQRKLPGSLTPLPITVPALDAKAPEKPLDLGVLTLRK